MIRVLMLVVSLQFGTYTDESTIPSSGWKDSTDLTAPKEIGTTNKTKLPGAPNDLGADGDYPSELDGGSGCINFNAAWIGDTSQSFEFCSEGGSSVLAGTGVSAAMATLRGILKIASSVLYSWVFVRSIYTALRQG